MSRQKTAWLYIFVLLFGYSVPAAILIKSNGPKTSPNDINSIPESETMPPITMTGPIFPAKYGPYFDTTTPRNVTALVGKSAYLTCRVRNLGNKTVSWIRHRDIHILTVGSYTYTSDQRFQANHHAETDEWTLQVKWAQKRDAGIYECQISTQPVRSYFVNLNVVEVLAGDEPAKEEIQTKYASKLVPTAQILGGPDLHVDKGSTINLTCSIRFSPEPPAYIFWYHQDDSSGKIQSLVADKLRKKACKSNNAFIPAEFCSNEVISYDSSRGGVSVLTEKGEVTTSFLLIQQADASDSGKYSCSPSNADVASVRVHVLNGERPAAMQTGSCGSSNSALTIAMILTLLYVHTRYFVSIHINAIGR